MRRPGPLSPSRARLSATAAALLLALSAPLFAQSFREELDRRRPEAWAMRYFAAATQSTGVGIPASRRRGEFDLGLEADNIPHLSAAQRTVGFSGTKVEDLNRTPVVARPRAALGLGGDVSLVVDWVPPVEVNRTRANVISVALERPLLKTDTWSIGARLGGGSGNIRGDFTCTEAEAAAGDDPVRNPYGCAAPSRDVQSYHWNSAALVVSRQLSSSVAAYASASVWRLDALFRVNSFHDGDDDHTRLAYAGYDWGATAGLDWSRGRWDVGAEVFYAPLDVVRDFLGRGPSSRDDLVNFRLRISYKLR